MGRDKAFLWTVVFDLLQTAASEHGAIEARAFHIPRWIRVLVTMLDDSHRSLPLESAEGFSVRANVKLPRSLKPWSSTSILPCASCWSGGTLFFGS
jgi:hypothetical protein